MGYGCKVPQSHDFCQMRNAGFRPTHRRPPGTLVSLRRPGREVWWTERQSGLRAEQKMQEEPRPPGPKVPPALRAVAFRSSGRARSAAPGTFPSAWLEKECKASFGVAAETAILRDGAGPSGFARRSESSLNRVAPVAHRKVHSRTTHPLPAELVRRSAGRSPNPRGVSQDGRPRTLPESRS